jgi:hypothetical protein
MIPGRQPPRNARDALWPAARAENPPIFCNGGRALINRFRLAPISEDSLALNTLCRTVGVEQGLGLCILVVVSVLGTWPPAIYGAQ